MAEYNPSQKQRRDFETIEGFEGTGHEEEARTLMAGDRQDVTEDQLRLFKAKAAFTELTPTYEDFCRCVQYIRFGDRVENRSALYEDVLGPFEKYITARPPDYRFYTDYLDDLDECGLFDELVRSFNDVRYYMALSSAYIEEPDKYSSDRPYGEYTRFYDECRYVLESLREQKNLEPFFEYANSVENGEAMKLNDSQKTELIKAVTHAAYRAMEDDAMKEALEDNYKEARNSPETTENRLNYYSDRILRDRQEKTHRELGL